MKTIKQFAIILGIASLTVKTVNAQNIIQAPQQPKTKPSFNNQAPPPQQNPSNNGNNYNGNGNPKPKSNDKWWINVGVGGGPNWGAPPPYYQNQNYGYGYGNNYGYNNYYGNNYGYNYRRVARKTIRKTAYILHNAIQQAQWNGVYNPILSNAVNHQQYAKFLYNQGEFIGALHHSKRARYLAWEAINFNYSAIGNPGYDDWDDDDDYGNYYGGGNNNNGGGYGNGYYDDSYKKNGNNNSNGNKQIPPGQSTQKTPSNDELDNELKKKEMTKDEMQKMKLSDLDIQ